MSIKNMKWKFGNIDKISFESMKDFRIFETKKPSNSETKKPINQQPRNSETKKPKTKKPINQYFHGFALPSCQFNMWYFASQVECPCCDGLFSDIVSRELISQPLEFSDCIRFRSLHACVVFSFRSAVVLLPSFSFSKTLS